MAAQRVTKIYPISQPRRVIISRQSAQAGVISTSSKTSSSEDYASAASDPELLRLRTTVGERIESRNKQKEQMTELNERLADYVEKVRFLDAQNRRLTRELDVLRDRHGKETDLVKARYQFEVSNLENLVRQTEIEKAEAEANLKETEERQDHLRVSLEDLFAENLANQGIKDSLNQQLADMEGEIALLKRRSGTFDDVKKRNKAEIIRLRSEEARLKKDLESEVLGRCKAEMEATFLKDLLETTEANQIMRWQDMANRVYRDSTAENRQAWTSEFKAQFRKIQESFEERVQEVQHDVSESMSLKIRQNVGNASRDQFEMTMIKTETSALSSRMSELNSRINSITISITQHEMDIKTIETEISVAKSTQSQELADLREQLSVKEADKLRAKEELQKFFDLKLSTEVELATYKKLLESEAVSLTIDSVDFNRVQTSSSFLETPKYFSFTKGYCGSGGSAFSSSSASGGVISGGAISGSISGGVAGGFGGALLQ
jgi:intermediate filament protein if